MLPCPCLTAKFHCPYQTCHIKLELVVFSIHIVLPVLVSIVN